LTVTSRLPLLALAALLLLLPLRGADAASPGPAGNLVFVDSGGDIAVTTLSGTVSSSGVAGTSPTWSPAADTIAFVSGGSIETMSFDGTGFGTPSAVAGPPSASPSS
jgi:hypothetical protein